MRPGAEMTIARCTLVALACLPAVVACSPSDPVPAQACPPRLDTSPAIAVRASLPDLNGLGPVDCATGSIDSVKARQIYDAFFGPRLPKSEADFQFASMPSLLSEQLVNQVTFPTVSGASLATYHALFSFDPAAFTRPASAGTPNVTLFASFGTDPQEPYKRVNVLDYIPATFTHYARVQTGTTDVMATQFVFRMVCMKAKMDAALASCPDCVDAFTPLSHEDLGRVLELRFARVSSVGALEVSRPFKVVGVDASGAIADHATKAPYPFLKVNGTWLRARWRGEVSGAMALTLGTYGGPTAALVRAAIGPAPGTPTSDAGAEGGIITMDGGVSPTEVAPSPPPAPSGGQETGGAQEKETGCP